MPDNTIFLPNSHHTGYDGKDVSVCTTKNYHEGDIIDMRSSEEPYWRE